MLDRVVYRPNGGERVPLYISREADGVRIVRAVEMPDSRGPGRIFRGRAGSKYLGGRSDVEAVLANAAYHVAFTAAHNALEFLRLESGELVHDPHDRRFGEPIVFINRPRVSDE